MLMSQHLVKDKVHGGSSMNSLEIATSNPLAYRSPMTEDHKYPPTISKLEVDTFYSATHFATDDALVY